MRSRLDGAVGQGEEALFDAVRRKCGDAVPAPTKSERAERSQRIALRHTQHF
jgi:hypothetical protein